MCLATVTLAMAQQAKPKTDGPSIKFEKTTHDFGTFSETNSTQKCVFTFTNVGKSPLIINQAIASCGCTVPSFPEKPIAPGDSGVIKITYNGLGYYPGTFKKVITVMTNAKTRMMRLYIEGNMKARTATKK